jgi:biotin operon repressor
MKKSELRQLIREEITEMARTATNVVLGPAPTTVLNTKNPKLKQLISKIVKIVSDAGDGGISRSEIARKLNTTQPAINSLINTLIEEDILFKASDLDTSKPSKSSLKPAGKRFNGPAIEKKIQALVDKGYTIRKQNSKPDGSWYYKIQEPIDLNTDRGIGIGYSAFSYNSTEPNEDYFYHNSHGNDDNKIGNVWNHSSKGNPGPGGWYTFNQEYIENELNTLSSKTPSKPQPKEPELPKTGEKGLEAAYSSLYSNEYPSRAKNLGFVHLPYLKKDRDGSLYFHTDWPRQFRHTDEYGEMSDLESNILDKVEEFESKVSDLFDKFNVEYNAHA